MYSWERFINPKRNYEYTYVGLNLDLRLTSSQLPPVDRYEVRQDCTLITVGEVFKTSFYAFAFERGQKSQQLRKRVNTALLEMHDTGAQQVADIIFEVFFGWKL